MKNNKLIQLKKELKNNSDSKKAQILQKFFKTGKGEYGEGDKFLGIPVPVQRKIIKDFLDLSVVHLQKLLLSKVHEERLSALLILVSQFEKAFKEKDAKKQKEIFDFYLGNSKNINNWDLVDLSAPNIVGKYLLDKKRDALHKLACSKNLWEKRIAVVSTHTFIRSKESRDTFLIVKKLLTDEHDLIHKACGWMLREVGNKMGHKEEEKFLKKNYKKMPRTMLRYAIERFPEKKRQAYLKDLI